MDFTPLASLTRLESLSLDNTQIHDLAPLTKCKVLQALFVEHTTVSDLTPLVGLTQLDWLNINARPSRI